MITYISVVWPLPSALWWVLTFEQGAQTSGLSWWEGKGSPVAWMGGVSALQRLGANIQEGFRSMVTALLSLLSTLNGWLASCYIPPKAHPGCMCPFIFWNISYFYAAPHRSPCNLSLKNLAFMAPKMTSTQMDGVLFFVVFGVLFFFLLFGRLDSSSRDSDSRTRKCIPARTRTQTSAQNTLLCEDFCSPLNLQSRPSSQSLAPLSTHPWGHFMYIFLVSWCHCLSVVSPTPGGHRQPCSLGYPQFNRDRLN